MKIQLLMLLMFFLAVYGNCQKVIHIDARENIAELKLSEIASEVIPISFSNSNTHFDEVFLTNKYLFIASKENVFQYDMKGNLLGQINSDKWISGLTGDESSSILIVAVDKQLLFYDFKCQLKEAVEVKDPVSSCFYHNNKIWIQSGKLLSSEEYTYIIRISYWDINAKKEFITSFEHLSPPISKEQNVNFMPKFAFSTLNDKIVFSFPRANALYEINGDHIEPIIKWDIHPLPTTLYEKGLIATSGVVGKYLFINYNRTLTKEEVISQNTSYLYMEDLNSGKSYNIKFEQANMALTSGIKDDMFYTGYCKIKRTNRDGYFFFVKSKSNLLNEFTLREGNMFFIVKTKM